MVSIVRRQHLVQTLTLKRRLIGMYCVIFAAFAGIQHKRSHNGSKVILLFLVTANFIACTAYLAVDLTSYQKNTLGWLLASDALYTTVDLISQVILVKFFTYDTYTVPTTDASVFKDISMLDVVAPTMGYGCPDLLNNCILRCQSAQLELKISHANLSLGISLVCLAITPSVYPSFPPAAYNLFNSLVLSFFSLSLAENALATGLIVYKILAVYRAIQGLASRDGQYPNEVGRDVLPILSFMIESGVITFMAQLVQILTYKFEISTAYPIIGGLVVQLYVNGFTLSQSPYYIYLIMQGISTAIVIVRVEMGLSYDLDNRTSTTLINFKASANDWDDTG